MTIIIRSINSINCLENMYVNDYIDSLHLVIKDYLVENK